MAKKSTNLTEVITMTVAEYEKLKASQRLSARQADQINTLKDEVKRQGKAIKSNRVATKANRENTLWAVGDGKSVNYVKTRLYTQDADLAKELYKTLVKYDHNAVVKLSYAQWQGYRQVSAEDFQTVKLYERA